MILRRRLASLLPLLALLVLAAPAAPSALPGGPVLLAGGAGTGAIAAAPRAGAPTEVRSFDQPLFTLPPTDGAPGALDVPGDTDLGEPFNPGAAARNVGRLFFQSGRQEASCTATAVNSSSGSVALTAGHCVHSIQEGWARNVTFVPGYDQGEAPAGVWEAEALHSTPQWIEAEDGAFDVAFIRLRPRQGQTLQQAVGAQGIQFGDPDQEPGLVALGYPGAPGGPRAPEYDGEQLRMCAQASSPELATDGRTLGMECLMSQGFSGGPWMSDFNAQEGTGIVVGDTSFSVTQPPEVAFAPRLDEEALAAYQAADSGEPTEDSPQPSTDVQADPQSTLVAANEVTEEALQGQESGAAAAAATGDAGEGSGTGTGTETGAGDTGDDSTAAASSGSSGGTGAGVRRSGGG